MQQVFGSAKPPKDLIDALTEEDNDGETFEEVGTKVVGNIAAAASMAVSRATPIASRTWSRFFGGAEAAEAEAQGAPEGGS